MGFVWKFFLYYKIQRSVRPVPQSITFDIVSRCFENKNNNCWETKLYKNAIGLLFTSLQIHFWQLCSLDVVAAGLPDYGFVKIKQTAFLQKFVSQQLLFLFSKHLDTMSNVTDCGTGRTDLWNRLREENLFFGRKDYRN